MAISPGTQGITFNSKRHADSAYEAEKRAVLSQHGKPNPYIAGEQAGIKEVFERGAAEEISKSRSNYGATTITKDDVLEGQHSNFAQGGDVANNPNADPVNTTGNLATGVSATRVPQEDPGTFQAKALEDRLAMYAGKMPQGESSLNRREQTMRG